MWWNNGLYLFSCKAAAVKLETVCFMYLWSLDSDAVLTAMSLFRLLCEEAELRCSADEMPPEYFVYAELASAHNLQSVGKYTFGSLVGMVKKQRMFQDELCCRNRSMDI